MVGNPSITRRTWSRGITSVFLSCERDYLRPPHVRARSGPQKAHLPGPERAEGGRRAGAGAGASPGIGARN